jgi:ABC-type sugar transport system permease subunit
MYDLKGTFVGQAAAMSIVNFALVVVIILVFLRVNGWNRAEGS